MRIKVLSILALLLAPAVSLASIGEVWNDDIAYSKTDWVGGTLSFPQFNHPGWTLLGVKLDLSALMDTELTVTNSAATASSGSAQTELLLAVQDAGGWLTSVNPNPPQNQPPPQYLPQITLQSGWYAYSLGSNESVQSGTLTKTDTYSNTFYAANILNEFTGSGNVTLDVYSFTHTVLDNTGGNTAADQVTNCSLDGTVTYLYETPEPASLALMGIAGLMLRRRRTA